MKVKNANINILNADLLNRNKSSSLNKALSDSESSCYVWKIKTNLKYDLPNKNDILMWQLKLIIIIQMSLY